MEHPKNRFLIAAAGSGKTTFLVKEALKNRDKRTLITTFTEANRDEIKQRFEELNGCIPANIHIQTWFSFLLRDGVRPFQALMDKSIANQRIGFYLTEKPSGFRFNAKQGFPVYWGVDDFRQYYFTNDYKIFSDKISHFVARVDEKANGELFKRISNIYDSIFIDEAQDLAGWDLEIVKLLLKSKSTILLCGDPRQVTYLTHHPKKYSRYKEGKIADFITDECPKDICVIDKSTLNQSHRNNKLICLYSSKIYPEYEAVEPCECTECRKNVEPFEGMYLVRQNDVSEYLEAFPTAVVLREKEADLPEWNYGKSKGKTFPRVLIYPTKKIEKYIKSSNIDDIMSIRAKFYVAVTRARYSAAIIYSYSDDEEFSNFEKFK